MAYGVKRYQVIGPAWLDSERYDIIATVAPGSTIEQLNPMLQNLLKERFSLAVHHEQKDFPVDELVIAKGGPRLKETALDPNAPMPASAGNPFSKRDKDGFPDFSGRGLFTTITAGPSGPIARMTGTAQGVGSLALALEGEAGRPVLDKTGLTGEYDFRLEYTPDLNRGQPIELGGASDNASEPGSGLAATVERQLGLKLLSAKAKFDLIVVDKADKVPAAN